MKNINGQGNEITIILPHKKIDCISSHHEQFNQIIHQSHIIITGNNNHVSMHFDSEENVEKLLLNEGFLLIIKGNNNTVNLGTIILRYSNILGMSGLKLIIGQLPGLGAGVSRVANNCRVDIGNRVVINGVTLYLQEDKSNVSIGEDSQLSWGIDIWCTNAHTITNLKGEPINFAQSIIIRKSKFPQNPKRSVRFSGKGTKRSVQKKESAQHSKSRNKRFVITSVSAL